MTNPEHREAPKEYKIREATLADAEAIARIQYDSWLVTYPNEEAGITKEDICIYLGDREERAEKWNKNLEESSEEVKTFVAEDGGRVVGFCAVAKQGEENHINTLYLDLNYKGTGTASKLFKEALRFLGEEKPVTLEVAAYNDRARGFYKHHGFQEGKSMMDIDKINGKELPIIVMRRPARSA